MRAFLAVFMVAVVIGATCLAEVDDDRYRYYTRAIAAKKGLAPACTPFRADSWNNKIRLRDPNGSWGSARLGPEEFQALTGFEGFDECVAAVPAYAGRITPAVLKAASEGKLSAGMPLEVALMIFGPPTEAPARVSWLNPMTGSPENRVTYTWIHLNTEAGSVRTFFSILGAAALGVVGVTSNLNTAITASRVAAVAYSAETIAWEVSAMSPQSTVTIQADDKGMILMLTQTGPSFGLSSPGQVSAPQPQLPLDQWITYEVAGRACSADVMYNLPDGAKEEQNVPMGWSKSFSPEKGQSLYVMAKNRCDTGEVTVKIRRGEKILKTATQEGPQGNAFASASN